MLTSDFIYPIYMNYVGFWDCDANDVDAAVETAVKNHWCGYVLARDNMCSDSLLDAIEKALRKLMRPPFRQHTEAELRIILGCP